MKVLTFIESIFLKSGLGSSFRNQQKALSLNNIQFTLNPSEDFDIIDINSIGPKSYFLMRKAKKHGKKIAIHTHVTKEDFRNSFIGSNLFAPLLGIYLRYFYGRADLIICPSEYTRQIIRSYGIKKPISIISNGVDTKSWKFSHKKRKDFKKKNKVKSIIVCSVGHIFPRKGIDSFVNTAKHHKDISFFWFGNIYKSFPARSKKIKRILKNKPANATFYGYIDDIVKAYSAADIFFFPSFEENQGIAILEAAAIGLPIVVRDIPVFNKWLIHGENCLKAKSDEEFAFCLQKLAKDKKLRKKLGAAAKNMAKEHDIKIIGKQLKDAYLSIK